jgi:hypothetical protein
MFHQCFTKANVCVCVCVCVRELQQPTLVLSQRGPVSPESETSYLPRPAWAIRPVVPSKSATLPIKINIPSIFPTHHPNINERTGEIPSTQLLYTLKLSTSIHSSLLSQHISACFPLSGYFTFIIKLIVISCISAVVVKFWIYIHDVIIWWRIEIKIKLHKILYFHLNDLLNVMYIHCRVWNWQASSSATSTINKINNQWYAHHVLN